MRQKLERGGFTANYDIGYFVGSGSEGRSYLIEIAGRLFQSPASYYTDRKAWDVSPGFQNERDLDFDRPITAECLYCHADRPRPLPFALNSYETPPLAGGAITCSRCHGSPERHLASPGKDSIVNPAKLKPALRDAVCEQCHLAGEARIVNPGRQLSDYRPGEALEDTLSVYVFDAASSRTPFKVISHSEQLAASECARASGGRMWCGTCHDPHNDPAQPAAYYRERCEQCHSPASLSQHAKPAIDCVGCHMPRRQAYDGGHTAFTDHRIQRIPGTETASAAVPDKLWPWRAPKATLAARNLGLAHISAGERHQSETHLNEGFRLLATLEPELLDDPAVLTSVGAVLQRKGVPREAARRFARAAELEPRDARHHLNLAVALTDAGDTERAIRSLETAIALDASLWDAYVLLSEIHEKAGHPEKRRQVLEQYLRFMPQSIVARKMLRRE